MKILLAFNSFKGTYSSLEFSLLVKKYLEKANEENQIMVCPLVDGGTGSLEVLKFTNPNSEYIKVKTHNAIFKKITCEYLKINDKECFIDSSRIIGLDLLDEREKSPYNTTSYGLGEVIIDALKRGFSIINVSLGGSATNDGGTGLLKALGYSFYDNENKEIKYLNGGSLKAIKRIDDTLLNPAIKEIKLRVYSDVNNSLVGEYGATKVFAKQKGAKSVREIQFLEEGMINYQNILDNYYKYHFENVIGAGSAGGIGLALFIFSGYKGLYNGSEYFMGIGKFEEKVEQANYVFLGEGQVDSSSFMGKSLGRALKLIQKYKAKPIVISGLSDEAGQMKLSEYNPYISYSLFSNPESLKYYKKNTPIVLKSFINYFFDENSLINVPLVGDFIKLKTTHISIQAGTEGVIKERVTNNADIKYRIDFYDNENNFLGEAFCSAYEFELTTKSCGTESL